MKRIILRAALACFFGMACAALGLANETAALQRYGVIIGINEGGAKRTTLRFAASDAQGFAAVMQEMGGLPVANRIMLLNPMLDDITQAFSDMNRKIAAARNSAGRQEFVVYYSGHSDEEGLLIGDQRLSYKDLRALIAAVPADVRIAVIDSCASGVFIRTKGGVQRPPFMLDAAVSMKGYAFLTSSSETEAAQESDNIEASFFTHYLVSGLRGAADADHDGVITLNEAYQYAFNETLVRTEKTQYGPQHPSYDIQLSGTGDLVLTDLRETSAGLVLEDKVLGHVYIRDPSGKLVVELNKQEKSALEIGLSAGQYTVLVDANGSLRQTGIRLVTGRLVTLRDADLTGVSPEATVRRGDEEPPVEADAPPADKAGQDKADATTVPDLVFQTRGFRFTFFPGFTSRANSNIIVTNYLALNLTVGSAQAIRGADLSLIGSIIERDLTGLTASSFFNIVKGDMSGVALSLGFNIMSGQATGYQGAALFNIARGDYGGVQAAGLFNYAGSKMTGVQLGLVNYAKNITGVQIGLINISDDSNGVALGLVNIEKHGIHDIECWQDTGDFTNLAFKLGTKTSYGLVLGGYDFAGGSGAWRFGLGLGFRLPISSFFIDLDAVMLSQYTAAQDIWSTPFQTTLVPQLRLKAGVKLFGLIGLYAGVSVQAFIPGLLYDPALMSKTLVSIPTDDASRPINVVPSLIFGISLF